MPTAAPRHVRTHPSRSSTLRHAVAWRRGTVVTAGVAVVVPGAVGAWGSPTAIAAPTTAPTITPKAAPSAPKAPTQMPVLRYGAKGSDVRVLQQRLGAVSVDGSFGPATLAAVKSFQGSKSLSVDGIVGPKTWKALGAAPGKTTPKAEPSSPSGTCSVQVVRYGSTGSAVKELQSRLSISTDGNFGPGTLTALKKFQSSKALSADGVAGPNTWKALGGYPCGTSSTPSTPNKPSTPTPDAPSKPSSSATGQRVLDIAKKYIGIDYAYGEESPEAGFDCSGLTQFVYRQVGVELPRTSAAQSQFGAGVDLNSLQVGDLVFFHSPIRHVAIYAGDGLILDASQPGTSISIHKMWVPPVKAIRVV
ncbi:peptidoglycan-binding protein [Demetria terragena]|uniref:C40 family peptidase n=1 Tax=Demetria terragena TaxID=63959 RepID=UPI00037278B5|nr:peptidoglycan-binding protein [Demetria terragena]